MSGLRAPAIAASSHGGRTAALLARASASASAGGSGWLVLGLRSAFAFGQFGANGNVNYRPRSRFNVVLYAILALGLNIVVGWAGLLDLGYIAFFGAGAYGYALFSSHAFGNLVAVQTGELEPPADDHRDRSRSCC